MTRSAPLSPRLGHQLAAAAGFVALMAAGCRAPDARTSAPSPEFVAAAPAAEAAAPSIGTADDRPPSDPTLRDALLELRVRDQAARASMIEAFRAAEPGPDGSIRLSGAGADAMRAVAAVDRESSAFLARVLADHGWPTPERVGRDGADAAWLLVQHADEQPGLQARALELMRPLAASGAVRPAHVALLTDRVRLGRGEEQAYGTQFVTDESGVQRPAPIEDPATVDVRRAEVGLPPLAEYARELADAYGLPASPEPMPGSAGSPAP